MKKILFLLAVILSVNILTANPVDVEEAMALGRKFVGADLSLAHTAYSDRNAACFYVFNAGDAGFVIISADDFYRPIIGYSENGAFDVNNVPPALQDYLDGIVAGRSANLSRTRNAAAPDIAADWRMLEKTGRLVSRNGGKGTDYFVKTKWDQSYPYNCCCPADPAGSGGHAIVGCLATSMSQLMRFWQYPEQGIGSHCYYHPDYGQICADFGNTTYDWANMPLVLDNNSSQDEKIATGTLCFHCGVTIDMGYGPDGSGGASAPIPGAMHNYFNYSNAIVQLRRDDFETETWKDMVREQFDMGWPMYYGGCDDGCHAFICDGYDDYDMFHFNLGWGGSSDGWYIIDEAPYTNPADAMFNFVPQTVYDATPSAPTNLVVTPASDVSFDATLSWTNPTTYLDGTPMTDIESVVIMRNNQICHVITDGIEAGQQMSFVDNVPYYDTYKYKVYVVSNGHNGKQIMQKDVKFGPTCQWRIVMTTTNFQGWKGNHIALYNMANTEVGQFTMPSSASVTANVDVPVGRVKFVWTQSNEVIDNLSFSIYDASNNKLFEYSGSSTGLDEGVFLDANNGCGNAGTCAAPADLDGTDDGTNIVLQWSGSLEDAYAYCIYRDDVIYRMVTDNSQPFVDDNTGNLGHCYNVSVLCENGESEMSDMICVSVGEACNPARNLWFYKQSNGRPVLTWDSPENHSGLTGYYIYRKCNGDDYKHVKSVSASYNEYKETYPLEYGNWYYYKVVAYYKAIDCRSIPAQSRYGNEYFVKMYCSPESIDENMAQNVEIFPNPAKDQLTIKAEDITEVAVYNSIGQKVFSQDIDADELVINTSDFDAGIYMVRIKADGAEVTRKISIIK